ncbi:uncharacterized protein [Euphorbia lathyris]|uniref:uncharacterized protein n=1 Tax=Euphorbia lathyris TaxID=212925 RepID=UPI00331380B9
MPAFWFSLKKSWQCKSQPSSEVHDPRAMFNLGNSQTQARKSCGFVCSRSVSNLREIIHGAGSKRHSSEKPVICSPRSLASCDIINPITHQVVVNDSISELKIRNFMDQRGVSSAFLGTLRPGTPRLEMASNCNRRRSHSLPRKMIHGRRSDVSSNGKSNSGTSFRHRISIDTEFDDSSDVTCKKCFNKFKNLDAVEEHNLSNHAVTELKEGDSSRKIVEIICRSTSPKSNFIQIKTVIKIHNNQATISDFEKHRESVKIKATKLQTRHPHPRCIADGNELLRFHGTNVACSLGVNGEFILCKLKGCGVCGVLRNGFGEKDVKVGEIGVFTASSSGRAMEEVSRGGRKGLVICRVIAGRVHKPVENYQELAGKFGFDSLAGKIGQHSNVEELYFLNPKALLPCFVVL